MLTLGNTCTGYQQLATAVGTLQSSAAAASAPFEWVDGLLVEAMRHGDIILIDELNLAEDAVLERLNRCAAASSFVLGTTQMK